MKLSYPFSVCSTANLKTIHQWQITLLIFAAVGDALNVIRKLANEGVADWRVSACFTAFLGPMIYIYCKNYLEEYVHLETLD